MTSDELIASIKGSDEKARGEAWQHAGPIGATAIKPLAELAGDADFQIARAATRAMWVIVRHAGRPGADADRDKTVSELLVVLGDPHPHRVHADVIWMLSEIGGEETVKPLAALLQKPQLREDARMALERIDVEASVAALQAALKTSPEDFRPNLAQSLRRRGDEVSGVPSARLVPVKATKVQRKAENPA